jgi:VWFA-related protein
MQGAAADGDGSLYFLSIQIHYCAPIKVHALHPRVRHGMAYPKILLFMGLLAIGAWAGADGPGAGPSANPTQGRAGVQGQRPGPPGTIRVRVRLIPVDVIVTDPNGRPVADLKREDFQLLENGRPQDIRHFTIQTLAANAAAPDPRPAPPTGQASELPPQTARTFLIMMGRGRFQTPFKSVDALIRFVRKDLLPQDKVAVFAYNRATNFTADHEKIAQLLERYKAMHEKIESALALRMSGLAAIYGSKDIPKSFQPDIDRIFASPAGVDSRKPTPGDMINQAVLARDARTATDQMLIPETNPSRNEFTRLEADAITDLPFEEYASTFASTHQDMQNIFTCIEYLRYMEGEKHLLFFTSDGLFLPRLEHDESIASMANDARVAIDTFQTGGLNPTFSFSRTFAVSSLRNISQLTGGRAAIYEDIGRALAHVNEITRVEYLLGYYPKEENWDGKYKRIEVKVNRPGLRVAYRHGYYARETLQPYDRQEFLSYCRITAAAAYAKELADVPFLVSTSYNDFGPPRIRVDMKIQPDKIGFKITDGVYRSKLYSAIFYSGPDGKIIGMEWGTMDLELPEARYSQVAQTGIRLSAWVPLKTPRQILKVIIYDTGNDRVGSKLIKMR